MTAKQRKVRRWIDVLLSRVGGEDPEEPPDAEAGEEPNELQQELLEGVREFHMTVAREVMVPRTEIQAVPDDATQEQAVEMVLSSGYSRLPVFHGSIDHIAGVVHAKDLLRCIKEDCADEPLAKIAREPYFIPETKKVDQLLSDFLSKHIQVAIVLDEYGGTAGLVTLEDLIEEIVGEIADEYDAEVTELEPVSPDEVQVSARVEIPEIEDYFHVDIPDGNFTTVGGWVTENTGRIPAVGERIELDGFAITVESADDRRVGVVRIVRLPGEDADTRHESPD